MGPEHEHKLFLYDNMVSCWVCAKINSTSVVFARFHSGSAKYLFFDVGGEKGRRNFGENYFVIFGVKIKQA
jgi:hypothetical protein